MDALVPAFVAALAAGIGDRPARISALLGDSGAIGRVLTGMAAGHLLGIAISVAGAMWIAPMLTPNARTLILAFALIFAGMGGLVRRAPPPRPTGAPMLAAATGSFVTGDRTSFLAFGIAASASWPVLAGVGALAGALVLAAAAATLGSRAWERLPLALAARISGAVLLIVGLFAAAAALRLA